MSTFDPRTGTLWASAIAFGGNGGVYVARKDPGDNVFQPSVMAVQTGGADKCWMAAGPRFNVPNSTRVYIAYNQGLIWSDDMGTTWTSPRSLGSGIGFLPRVGPNGEVYVAYWDFGTGLFMQRSLDGGASFTGHTIATRMDTWGTQDGSRFPGRFRVPPWATFDVDQNTGHLHAVYFDTTNIVNNQRNVDMYYTMSTNQGTTWTTPRIINGDANPPGDQFFAYIEVDQFSRLHVVSLDSRHTVQSDNTTNGMFDAYYTYSDDGGATWNEHRLTPASFNSANDNIFGTSQFIGDYLGIAVAGNTVSPHYVSTQIGQTSIYTHVIQFGPANATLDVVATTFGTRISGNINQIRDSDDDYYVIQSAFGFLSSEPNVSELQVRATWPAGTAASMDITAEGKLNNPNGITRVRLNNFDTASFDTIGTFPSGIAETVEMVNVAAADPYINDTNGRIILRLRTIVVATFSTSGFRASWDNVQIAVTP